MQKNQNNPVHGKKSGKTEFQIESLLPVGKENAVTTAELDTLMGSQLLDYVEVEQNE